MRYVLFVCNHNAGRSQMAQAFFERHAPADLRAESAGSSPADKVWPTVAEVMNEVGIDLSNRRPKRLTVEMQLHADWAITMGCGDACPYVPTTVEAWDIPDPAKLPMPEVRVIRDGIEEHVRTLLDERIDEIRSNKTAHALRLSKLLPPLVEEFGEVRDPAEIRACADTILEQFADVPIRSHVLTLARRRTEECLRAERCEPLATR